jgi:two-component system OmpR family response regulator
VLVVDEDAGLTRVVTLALGLERWDVAVAATGGEAIARVADFHPDGILLDTGLPDITGPQVVGALRAVGDETPVVFVTGRDSLEDRLEAFAAGGDDYLTKPFGLDELVARLRAVMGLSGGAASADDPVRGSRAPRVPIRRR